MATTKLTLSADEKVIRKARQLARRSNTSISAMFSRFVLAMSTSEERTPEERLGPLTHRALNLAQIPAGKPYRKLLEEALMDKYGIREKR